jgi:phospholipid-translocating ATPase
VEGQKKVGFTGSSQDEVTFLEMCRDVGFVQFLERDADFIKIDVQGQIERYEILKVVEFTSDRKRMSVVVRREHDGKVINFIKGADIAIIPRLAKTDDSEETI